MTPPQRPWWKRKRWIAAVVLFYLIVPIVWTLSAGPYYYCVGRGWIGSDDRLDFLSRFEFYDPVRMGLRQLDSSAVQIGLPSPGLLPWFDSYQRSWRAAGKASAHS